MDVDEHKTSITCYGCHKETCNRYDKIEGRNVKVHSILHCKNSECFNRTVNRDKNASQNILLLINCMLKGYKKP